MFTVVHLIPTGVGAHIGGFAGDATPVAHLLASVCDRLVTHPNALNAANLFSKPANALYVEGQALDAWLAGRWVLRPTRQKVGLLLDAAIDAMPPGTLEALLNAANAVRAVHGVELVGYHVSERPFGCRLEAAASGASTGAVADPEALLAGARRLVAAGATAIAVCADLGAYPEGTEDAYQSGEGVDPIGGLEAILSHLLVAELGLPAAHAPFFPFDPTPPPVVDPRAAAEYLGQNYLPCILQGLAGHPGLAAPAHRRPGDLAVDAVQAVVVPRGCLGGPGVLAAHERGIPILVVGENRTVMALEPTDLGWQDGVIGVANYWEAAGVLAAWRAGLAPLTCRRPLPPLSRL